MLDVKTHSVFKIWAAVLLIMMLCVSSCKESAPEPEPPQTGQETTTEVEQTQQEVDVETTPAEPQETAQDTAEPDLVPIPIELPKPMFVGTPQNIQGVTNLEKPRGKARPPFYAPEGTVNVAFGKNISASDEEPIMGEIDMITDGDKEASDNSYVELGPFKQHVQVDLGQEYEIYAILLWHFHKQAIVYFDVVVQVSNDPDFITDVTTVFNNDIDNSAGLGIGKDMHYVETSEGKLIDAKGIKAQYVRLYSNGNSSNDLNHYIEVEVFGKPAE